MAKSSSKNSQSPSSGAGGSSSSIHESGAPTTEYRLQKDDGRAERDALYYWDEEEELAENRHNLRETLRNQLESRSDLTAHQKVIVQRLAMKSFHIPGNGYWQDWGMFVCNNHIMLSFCLANPLHPFGRKERILNLLASLAFGLTATCLVVLWYHNKPNVDMDQQVVGYKSAVVTHGMINLAFFGGFCNVLFDFAIWFLQACPPCQPGGFLFDKLSAPAKFFWIWLGSNLAVIVTGLSICLAIHVMALRATKVEDNNDDDTQLTYSPTDYAFVPIYFAEVLVTQFIMFPVVAFTIFSGVLGCCGRVPGLGGRPYQVRKLHQRMEQKKEEQIRRALATTQCEV